MRSFKPSKPELTDNPSGRVRFDDRGNAIWETQSHRKLEHPGLGLSEEEPLPNASARPNVKAGRIGYNPYESGMVKKKKEDRPKKKNLRALSQWIKMKKNLPEET